MNGNPMTVGAPWKHIISFAFPIFLGNLLQQLYNTVDAIVVGNFASETALSAVGTTASFTLLFLAIAMGFSAGNGVAVAQYYGAGNNEKVKETAATGILMLGLMAVVSTIVGIAISRPAYSGFVGVPPKILELTLLYFRIYVAGLIFQFGYNILSSILRAVGDSKATLYFLLIASIINIVLDLVFVGIFKWSVVGAALATDISQALSFVAAYIYMIKRYPIFRFKIGDFKWNAVAAKLTVVLGFPIALQMMIVSTGMTLIQRAVNGFGKTMIASYTVGHRIEMFMNIPCISLQTTMATYTGQNIGAEKMDRVVQGTRQAVFMSIVFTAIMGGIIWLASDKIVDIFGLTESARVICNTHIKDIALINILLASYIPLFGLYQGANHPQIPAFVAVSVLTLRVFVTYLLRYGSAFGQTIVWRNGLFGFSLGIIICFSYYFSKRWQKNSSIKT